MCFILNKLTQKISFVDYSHQITVEENKYSAAHIATNYFLLLIMEHSGKLIN